MAPRRPRFLVPAAVVLLLAVHYLLAVSSVRGKSVAFDEIAHVTAGYSYWKTGDHRLQPENGVLPQLWGSLPLLSGGYAFPSLDQDAWRSAQVWILSHEFFYGSGNDARALLFRARLAAALVGVGVCALVFVWSRRLYGDGAALFALSLAAFSPTFLALGPIVTSDLFVTLTLTLSVGCLWWTLGRMSPLSLLASGLAVAALLLSKVSGVLILPVGAILVALRLLSREPLVVVLGERRIEVRGARRLGPILAALAIHAVLVFVVVWAAYGFRYSAFSVAEAGRGRFLFPWVTVLQAPGVSSSLLGWARAARVLPEAYLYSLAFVRWYVQRRVAFLNGHYSVVGWPAFFPYCFLVKTPLSLLLALVLGMVGTLRASWRRGEHSASTPLFVLLAVYGATSVATGLNLGHRHLAPIYPALYILAGSAWAWRGISKRVGTALVGALLVLSLQESFAIRPHYLAYFNLFAGGPRHAYRHLVDSSLDWGEDLRGLGAWLERHALRDSDASPVYLSYFGTGDPASEGVSARLLPSYFDNWRAKELFALRGGTYCLSATMLQSLYSEAIGPWAVAYEETYQQARKEIARYDATAADPEARRRLLAEGGEAHWRKIHRDYDLYRFGRLCAYLRQREPDDHVGYSILIYRLSDAQADEALSGPPAELVPEVRVAGMR